MLLEPIKLPEKYNKDRMVEILNNLGIKKLNTGSCIGGHTWLDNDSGVKIESCCPNDGQRLAEVSLCSIEDYKKIVTYSNTAFQDWKITPAPVRGQLIREIANELRVKKDLLGSLVAIEMGKIKSEGDGEVQEMIDIADFAVGLSRQLYGLTMHSERPSHRMYEQWHPIGNVGIISAFNFPVAVWAWNAFIAAVCGNISIWKPSSKTPLCAIAVQHICNDVLEKNGFKGIFNLMIGRGSVVGEELLHDKDIHLVSATGSTRMGKKVAKTVGARLGKTILELGGNNAIIVDDTANLDLAIPAIVFGAVGTAGQRCTSTRRIIVNNKIYDSLIDRLINAYKQIDIGCSMEKKTLMGPLIDQKAVDDYSNAILKAKDQGCKIIYGGSPLSQDGFFVQPTIVEAENHLPIVQEETFAPILYIMKYSNLEEGIKMQNSVPQGLSSSMFTNNIINSETFLSHNGSDCGIANINIGTSGAEIGGAFGGEKETGGGREAGSDSWKAYMRRQTSTINWSSELPLAQGIKFEL